MDIQQLTQKAREGLMSAQDRALELNHQKVEVEHLLLALLFQEKGLATSILHKADVEVERLRQALEEHLAVIPTIEGPGHEKDSLYASSELNSVLTIAKKEAQLLKDEFVSVDHLLLAITRNKSTTRDILSRFGVTRERLELALREVRGGQRVTSQNPESTYQALEQYGRDLTRLASQGETDPVIGRDDEIRRIMQVLSRRRKNNPVLIGAPGVGKTAIVEGLAQRIVRGDVPEGLKHKQVVAMDMGALIAGGSMALSTLVMSFFTDWDHIATEGDDDE